MNIDGTNDVLITDEASSTSVPIISPDGQWVSYIVDGALQGRPDKEGALYVVRADGTGKQLLTTEALSNQEPVGFTGWSPDGKTIAWVKATGPYSSELMTVDIATKSIQQLTYDGNIVYAPQWSPDGSQILFLALTNPTVESLSAIGIYLIDARWDE